MFESGKCTVLTIDEKYVHMQSKYFHSLVGFQPMIDATASFYQMLF